MSSEAWPSLADHVALAEVMFGDHGHRLVDEWLAAETARIDDPDFARSFADHVVIPGGRYRDLPAPDGRVTLEPFTDDLRQWHSAGQLRAIRADGQTVGLLAAAPGAITWIPGDEINEEVIDVRHRGHGYAAAAQRAWAKSVADDPDRHLIGTIDRLNAASRLTAERSGRPSIMEAVFVALDP